MDFDSEFAQFWAAYPRKRNKLEARKAFWSARRSGITLEWILAALKWQRHQSQWVRDGGQYIPHPATWLRAGSYDDEPDEPIAVPVKAQHVCPHDPPCGDTFKEWCLTRQWSEKQRESA